MFVFIQLMKGTFDDGLMRSFDNLIDSALIHQDDQIESITRTLATAKRDEDKELGIFQKPVNSCNTSWVYTKFTTLKELHDGVFIENDILYGVFMKYLFKVTW